MTAEFLEFSKSQGNDRVVIAFTLAERDTSDAPTPKRLAHVPILGLSVIGVVTDAARPAITEANAALELGSFGLRFDHASLTPNAAVKKPCTSVFDGVAMCCSDYRTTELFLDGPLANFRLKSFRDAETHRVVSPIGRKRGTASRSN